MIGFDWYMLAKSELKRHKKAPFVGGAVLVLFWGLRVRAIQLAGHILQHKGQLNHFVRKVVSPLELIGGLAGLSQFARPNGKGKPK